MCLCMNRYMQQEASLQSRTSSSLSVDVGMSSTEPEDPPMDGSGDHLLWQGSLGSSSGHTHNSAVLDDAQELIKFISQRLSTQILS